MGNCNDDSNLLIKTGYEVVYDYKGYTMHVGNHIIFPEHELAENYMKHYKSYPWFKETLYIREVIYEGRELKDCKEYNGKRVYNKDWYYGIEALRIGDYVEEKIIDELMECLPPACMRNDCSQIGEPSSHKTDNRGQIRATYATFKKVIDDIWEFCGDCFRGENMQHGKELPYVEGMK